MPIGSVYIIQPPVYSVASSVPSVSGAGATAAAIAAAAGGTVGGLADTVVFSKVVWTYTRGAPVDTYPISVALTGSVVRKGRPTPVPEGPNAELRPKSQTIMEITTGEDPCTALGEPAGSSMTHWRVEWAGFKLLVVGAAIPQGSGWLTEAVLTL
jgi:hypothetical protein